MTLNLNMCQCPYILSLLCLPTWNTAVLCTIEGKSDDTLAVHNVSYKLVINRSINNPAKLRVLLNSISTPRATANLN